jgi:hypothetical protein
MEGFDDVSQTIEKQIQLFCANFPQPTNYFTSKSSTSKTKVELGGITGGAPRSP